MSREAFLKIAHSKRAIPSSAAFDILTTKVVVRTRTWTGGVDDVVDQGEIETDDVEILPRPRVTEVDDDHCSVSPIQPRSALGGHAPSDLFYIAPTDGMERFWVLTGPDGIERAWVVDRIVTDKALHYTVYLSSLDRRNPK